MTYLTDEGVEDAGTFTLAKEGPATLRYKCWPQKSGTKRGYGLARKTGGYKAPSANPLSHTHTGYVTWSQPSGYDTNSNHSRNAARGGSKTPSSAHTRHTKVILSHNAATKGVSFARIRLQLSALFAFASCAALCIFLIESWTRSN